MAIAYDLLTLASHLVTPAATEPEQAWFRRSIQQQEPLFTDAMDGIKLVSNVTCSTTGNGGGKGTRKLMSLRFGGSGTNQYRETRLDQRIGGMTIASLEKSAINSVARLEKIE